MRKFIISLTMLMVVLPAFSSICLGKDLTNRISAGYNKQLTFGVIGGADSSLTNNILSIDSLACKYWITEDIGVELFGGYFTAKYDEVGGWALDLGGKFYYNMIKEDNMNLYSGAGLGIIPLHIDYGNDEMNETGFQAMAYAGIEFFFSGLPNLGFDMEVGLQYIDIDEYAQLSTYGGAFSTFGIRYYF